MTATPIPRTVALTFYGDLDLSTLNETPEGRQKITTWVVPKEKRDNAYKWIDKNIQKYGSPIVLNSFIWKYGLKRSLNKLVCTIFFPEHI